MEGGQVWSWRCGSTKSLSLFFSSKQRFPLSFSLSLTLSFSHFLFLSPSGAEAGGQSWSYPWTGQQEETHQLLSVRWGKPPSSQWSSLQRPLVVTVCAASLRPAGGGTEEGDVLQSWSVPEALHPAWEAQHLPIAAAPRPGAALHSGVQHHQPPVELRGTTLAHRSNFISTVFSAVRRSSSQIRNGCVSAFSTSSESMASMKITLCRVENKISPLIFSLFLVEKASSVEKFISSRWIDAKWTWSVWSTLIRRHKFAQNVTDVYFSLCSDILVETCSLTQFNHYFNSS